MKKILFVLLLLTTSLFSFSQIDGWFGSYPDGKYPVVKLYSVESGSGYCTAIATAEVVSEGNYSVIERGLCWLQFSTSTPTVNDHKLASGSGRGIFTASYSNIPPNGEDGNMNLRAYAITSSDTIYSNIINLEKKAIPSVTAVPYQEGVGDNFANLVGYVDSHGYSIYDFYFALKKRSESSYTVYRGVTVVNDTIYTLKVTGLSPATLYDYYLSISLDGCSSQYFNSTSKSFLTSGISGVPPTVFTVSASVLSSSSAEVVGNAYDDGGLPITDKGTAYGTSPDPTKSNSYVSSGTDIGVYSSILTGLASNTTYYARAYATNSAGTSYGDNISFTTTIYTSAPMLTTLPITEISSTTAMSGGNITNDGGANVLVRGVCWATHTSPTTSDNLALNGDGSGIFYVQLFSLTPNTTYYARAFAINSIGTGYGDELVFTTTSSGQIPSVTTTSISSITSSSAISGGNVTSENGSSVFSRGVCYNNTGSPTTSELITENGSGLGSFTSNLTSLYSGTKYYVRAYAVNGYGTAYGNQYDFTTSIETTPSLYGFLYNWWAFRGDKDGDGTVDTYIANDGWHTPSIDETIAIANYLGGSSVSGNALKTSGSTYWGTDNAGANSSGFNGRGSGMRTRAGVFTDLKSYARYWQRYYTDSYVSYFILQTNSSSQSNGTTSDLSFRNDGHTIRLIKDSTTLTNGQTGTYTGNDGKVYSTVCIGGYEIMSEDLRETMFRDNTVIVEMQNTTTWSNASSAYRCYYVP